MKRDGDGFLFEAHFDYTKQLEQFDAMDELGKPPGVKHGFIVEF
jgi:hypothetical protein